MADPMTLGEIARALLVEKYAHPTPERTGGVDGPSRRLMFENRRLMAEEAQVVAMLPGPSEEVDDGGLRRLA